MPKTGKTFEDYKISIRSRSESKRSKAVDRHLELLTNSKKSLQGTFLSRMEGDELKKFGRDSQSYKLILSRLTILENFMDEVVTSEMETFARAGLMDTYASLLQACDEYLQSHGGRRFTKVGKARVQMVQELRQKADDEAQLVDERLSSLSSFGEGISLRQMLAGMRPLENITAQESDFSLPEQAITAQSDTILDESILEIQQLRETLKKDHSVDGNKSAILDILLEQVLRSYQRGEGTLCADLLDRVVAVCDGAEADSPLQLLSETCGHFKAEKGLASSTDDAKYSHGTKDSNSPYQGDELSDNAFPEYRHLNPDVARYLAKNTEFNKGKLGEHLYGATEDGTMSEFGGAHGYIQTNNSFNINTYLRELSSRSKLEGDSKKTHQDFASLRTIALLDQASQSTHLPEKTRLHRMLSSLYLTYNFGIEANGGTVPDGAIKAINQQAGKIITDDNFMCTGFNVDSMFASHPVMLTLLCDEGTPVFSTRNLAEGEIILGRGTQYMILGAIAHTEANPLNIPLSHLQISEQYVEGKEVSGDYKGVEIFAKVLSSGPSTENKSQSKEAFEAFQKKQISYKPQFFGDHGDMVHRDAYLAMSRADLASLTPQEAAAMDEYTNDSGQINRRLRSGDISHDVTDAQNTFIKQAFAKHPIPVAMEMYRGVSDGFLTFLLNTIDSFSPEEKAGALTQAGGINHIWMEQDEHYKMFEGVTFQDKAFVSTSTNKAFARRWANMVSHDEKTRANGGEVQIFDPVRAEDIDGAHVLNMHLPAGIRAMFTDAMFTRNRRPRGQDEVTVDAGYTYVIESVKRVGHGMYEMDVRCIG